MSENYRRPDYEKYALSVKEGIRYIGEGCVIVGLIGYFFYRSVKAAVLFSPMILLYVKKKKKDLCRKRRQDLGVQFKDALKSVTGSLQAGYSIENAFAEAYQDMVEYHGKESIIAKELSLIRMGIRNNVPVEDLVEDMGNRSGVEDIQNFAGILRVGKQSGGNLHTLFENTMMVIEEKISLKQEIQTLISAKKLEARIMSVIPFGIILYVDLTSKGYFDALYADIAGRMLMSVCLAVYIAAIGMMEKIMNIEV